MATPNYGYEKRQRELAKKKKKEDKLRAKAAPARYGSGDDTPGHDTPAPTENQNPVS
ncbi:MAG: hypothetical protein ACTS5V_02175 [Giesbergeria sp.]